MEILPNFKLLRPTSVKEAAALTGKNKGARMLAGGTDLIVNLLLPGTGDCNTGDETVLMTTTTDANGFYLFENLDPDYKYQIADLYAKCDFKVDQLRKQ